MKYKIPFIRPDFPSSADIVVDYDEILAANWFTNFGPFEQKFAQAVATYVGDDYYAATCSSATAGLMASIITVLGRGDNSTYIVMPSFTFAAGADAVLWCGYRPLFVDVESNGLHMDLAVTEATLNDDTYANKVVAILFCNAFGVGTENIDEWESLAKKTELPLIIDSAAGFGSLYSANRKVGSAGLCEVFSFHATKPFAIGEGGAVVSRDKDLIAKIKSVQNFGFDGRNAQTLGFNGKLQEFNAAVGLRQFQTFQDVLQNRRGVLGRYAAELSPKRFVIQSNASNASLCFATIIVKRAEDRDAYLSKLIDAGVEAKTYYGPSLHKQEYFKACEHGSALDVTELVESSVLSLPIHDNMLKEDIDLIINLLNE